MMSERMYYSREAEMRARRNGAAVAALAVLLGAAAGVVVALLFAPQSGEHVREELARGAENLVAGAKSAGETLANQAGRAVEQVREQIEERANHA